MRSRKQLAGWLLRLAIPAQLPPAAANPPAALHVGVPVPSPSLRVAQPAGGIADVLHGAQHNLQMQGQSAAMAS